MNFSRWKLEKQFFLTFWKFSSWKVGVDEFNIEFFQMDIQKINFERYKNVQIISQWI